jgi:type IV pilus assembly protein PilQ
MIRRTRFNGITGDKDMDINCSMSLQKIMPVIKKRAKTAARLFFFNTAAIRIYIFALVILYMAVIPGDIPAQEPRNISMDFQQAALKDVLKVFSQQAGLNFVATENIENKQITLYLDNVTVRDALDSIMSANNLTYEQAAGSAIFIVKESGKPKIELMTKVYALDFARIAESGEGVVSAEGAFQETGGTSSGFTDIQPVIENLLSKGPDGSRLGSVVVDKRTNSLIITEVPDNFAIIEDTIKKLDSITPQALIEAEIVEIQTSALKSLGLEWGTNDGTFVRFTGPTKITHFPFIRQSNPFSKSLLGDPGTTETVTTDTSTTTSSIIQDPTLGVLSLQEFSFVIKALESNNMARYLAKPRIMSLSSETAEIKISSDTVVGVKKTSITDTGEVIEEAERVETGVTLKVTPTVNQKGYITMTIEPEISRAVQSAYFSNFVDPTKRSAKTTVMLKDGQTIAIGGLLKTDEEDSGRNVPGLSRIPLLGNLFRSKGRQSVETEIIVFITAHAILEADDIMQTAKSIKEPEEAQWPAASTPPADKREAEIQKTVIRLRKKRELERTR